MANRYWVGGTGNWSDTGHWSTSSGGASGAAEPTEADDVFFDANSFSGAGQTVTIDGTPSRCKAMNWTGATNSPALSFGTSFKSIYIYGSLTFIASMSLTGSGAIYFAATSGTNTITLAGQTIPTLLQVTFGNVQPTTATWSLQDTFSTTTNNLLFSAGTLLTNDNAINAHTFLTGGTASKTLTLGASTLTLTAWYASGSNITLSAGTSTIIITNSSNYAFAGGGLTYNAVTISATLLTISGDNTFSTLTLSPAGSGIVYFTAGSIQTITSSFICNGTTSQQIQLLSTISGTRYTLSKLSGTVTATYTSIRDSKATGGATWNDLIGGVDLGDNAGWNFTTYTPVQKKYIYKFYRDTTYLGSLPQSTEFGYSLDINTAATELRIDIPTTADVTSLPVEPLLDEAGNVLQDEAGQTLYEERALDVVGNDEKTLIRNGNRVKVYETSTYYPNGKLVFSGKVHSWEANFGGSSPDSITVVCYSDGLDLSNFVLQASSGVAQYSQESTNNQFASVDVGQSFKLTSSLDLGKISLYLQNNTLSGSIDTPYRLYQGNPISGMTPVSPVVYLRYNAVDAQWADIVFPSFIPLSAGVEYTIINSGGYQPKVSYDSTASFSSGSIYKYQSGYSVVAGALKIRLYSGTDGTTRDFTDTDPTAMVSTALTEYNGAGGVVTTNANYLTYTGLSLDYTFKLATIEEAIKKALELSPADWYWTVDVGTGILSFKQTNAAADFTLIKGRHISSLRLKASIENLKNALLFSGGDIGGGVNLYSSYYSDDSISNYGQKLDRRSDNRVTIQTTADAYGDAFINENSNEAYITSATVLDSAADITLYKPGNTVAFRGFNNFIDDLILQIVRINYSPDKVVLDLGTQPPRLATDLKRIVSNITAIQTVDNPSAPS